MTDHDRGAYTPQTDPPLAFDPRRPSERRPLPMALIGSAVVLVVLLAGVAMVYRGGVRQAGESPRPVGEPVMAVKTAPTPAQSAVANAAASAPVTSDAYAPPASAAADSPKLAPPPEQPAARPQPSPATVALLSKPAAPDHVERPQPAADAPPATVRTSTAASPSATAPAHIRPKVDEAELAAAAGGGRASRPAASDAAAPDMSANDAPKPVKLAAATTPRPTLAASAPSEVAGAAGAAGGAVVQIGAFSSTALADKGYADVSAAVPERMSGKAKHVLALDKDGTTLYRTWLSGFASRADATAFCSALKAKGMTCFVKG